MISTFLVTRFMMPCVSCVIWISSPGETLSRIISTYWIPSVFLEAKGVSISAGAVALRRTFVTPLMFFAKK